MTYHHNSVRVPTLLMRSYLILMKLVKLIIIMIITIRFKHNTSFKIIETQNNTTMKGDIKWTTQSRSVTQSEQPYHRK
jgi:hypothetical protein